MKFRISGEFHAADLDDAFTLLSQHFTDLAYGIEPDSQPAPFRMLVEPIHGDAKAPPCTGETGDVSVN